MAFCLKCDLSRYAKSQEISKINWGAFNFKNNNKNWYVGKKINYSNKGFSDNYKFQPWCEPKNDSFWR